MMRLRRSELMDDPGLDRHTHAHALRALNRINRLLGVDQRRRRGLGRLGPTDRMSVLDLGTGGGGFLAHLAERRGVMPGAPLLGLDRSGAALGLARAWYDGAAALIVGDAREIPLDDNSVDVVTCSLFLHHFDEPDVVAILRESARVARRGVLVVDLARSRLALALTWIATRLISRSPVFHIDGPRSVQAAFRVEELAELANQAGLIDARVEKQIPFGLSLVWRKPGGMHAPS